MNKAPILTLAGIALLTGLAGCTSTDKTTSPSSSPTSKPTSTSTQKAAADAEKCIDGVATVTATKGEETTFAEKCDTVWVDGSEGTIHLTDVKTIGIVGSKNKIDVNSVTTIDTYGDDNAITHGGTAPKIVGEGKNTTVTAK